MKVGGVVRGEDGKKNVSSVGAILRRRGHSTLYGLSSSLINYSKIIVDDCTNDLVGDVVSEYPSFQGSSEFSSKKLIGYFKIKSGVVFSNFARATFPFHVLDNCIQIPQKIDDVCKTINIRKLRETVHLHLDENKYLSGMVVGLNSSFRINRPNGNGKITVNNAIKIKLSSDIDCIKDLAPLAGRHLLDQNGDFVGIAVGGVDNLVFISPLADWVNANEFDIFIAPKTISKNKKNAVDVFVDQIDKDHLPLKNYLSTLASNRGDMSAYFNGLAAVSGVSIMENIQDETIWMLVHRIGVEHVVLQLFEVEIKIDVDGQIPSDTWIYRSIVERLRLAVPIKNGHALMIENGKNIPVSGKYFSNYPDRFSGSLSLADQLLGRNTIKPSILQIGDC